MIKVLHIKVGKKIWKFESVQAMEDFIFHNRAYLKGKFISLIDENNNITGNISIDSYLKFSKNVKSSK